MDTVTSCRSICIRIWYVSVLVSMTLPWESLVAQCSLTVNVNGGGTVNGVAQGGGGGPDPSMSISVGPGNTATLENSAIRVSFGTFSPGTIEEFAIREFTIKSVGQNQLGSGPINYLGAGAGMGEVESLTIVQDDATKKTLRVVWKRWKPSCQCHVDGDFVTREYSVYPNSSFVEVDFVDIRYALNFADLFEPGGQLCNGAHVAHGGDTWVRGYNTHHEPPSTYYSRYPPDGVNDPADGGSLNYRGHFVLGTYNPSNGRGIGRVMEIQHTHVIKLLLDPECRRGIETQHYPFGNFVPRFIGYIYAVTGGPNEMLSAGRALVDLKLDGPPGDPQCGDNVQLTALADAGWDFVNWTGAINSTQNPVNFTLTGNMTINANFTQVVSVYSECFETYNDGDNPADWLDTAAQNSLQGNDSLFQVTALGGKKFLSTSSTLANIHSHYNAAGSQNLTNYELTGKMRIDHPQGGVGVTFFSGFPFQAVYYRLRRFTDNAFHITGDGTSITGGDTDTLVVPLAGTWYNFRVQVEDTGSQTDIRANVWAEGTTQPVNWQADCFDSSPTRLTQGTIGAWSFFSGRKDWDCLTITTAPSLTLPADVTVNCDGDITPSATGTATAIDDRDPFPSVSFSDAVAGGSCPEESVITRTWTAVDACGNTASSDQLITVDDSTAPVITCPADVTIECDASSDPSSTGSATATDNCEGAPTITMSDSVASGSCPQASVITRTWTATDACGNSSTCVQTITVEDTTPPAISCPADDTVECGESTDPSNTGSATATDTCDGAPAVTFADASGPIAITRTWTATDACGNESTCVQTITLGGLDTDSDGLCDDGDDDDDDNDGIADASDPAPLDPAVCGDSDSDTCDDCSIGTDGFGPLADNDPANDGPDVDSDGLCDAGDDCVDDPGEVDPLTAIGIGLQGHYTFNDGGDLGADSSGNTLDATNNGVVGVSPGLLGDAADFGAVGDVLDLTTPDDSRLIADPGGFTLATWFNTMTAPTTQTIYGETANGQTLLLQICGEDCGASAGLAVFSIVANNGGGDVVGGVESIAVVGDGNWHHVAAVVNSDGSFGISIDGVLDNTAPPAASPLDISALVGDGFGPTIGSVGAAAPFGGLMDDLRIYCRPLSVEEIDALFELPGVVCPSIGDTRCVDLIVTAPEGNGEGLYTATATASDDSGDEIMYTFTASNGVDPPTVIGPQPSNVAEIPLVVGTWTISVEVDDNPICPDTTSSPTCEVAVNIGGHLVFDCNSDGEIDLTDSICLARHLFLGQPPTLPCGDGTKDDPVNISLFDFNGDGTLNISDIVASLDWLFRSRITGRGPHPLDENGDGTTCVGLRDCPNICEPTTTGGS